MAKVHVSVKGGNFKQGGDLRAAIEAAMTPAITKAALAVQAGIQGSTPVKTGNLRRSWNTGTPQWEGTRLQTKVGTAVVYARRVDAEGKSAGYVRKGLNSSQSQALGILREGVRAFTADTLWKRD